MYKLEHFKETVSNPLGKDEGIMSNLYRSPSNLCLIKFELDIKVMIFKLICFNCANAYDLYSKVNCGFQL